MGAYILRRLLIAIPSLLGISLILFTVLALAPGDPFSDLATNPSIPPEVRLALRAKFGLDDPVMFRYLHWLAAMARGHDLLSGTRWTGADLREIAMVELDHLASEGAGRVPRISLEGPPGVRLRADATQEQVLRQLGAPLVVPMHYFNPGTLERFVDRVRDRFEVRRSGAAEVALSRDDLPARPTLLVLPGR